MTSQTTKYLIAAALWLCLAATVNAAEEAIETQQVRGAIYMLKGGGGNVGLFVGDDGTIIIDDKFAPMSEPILEAIGEAGGNHPRFVVNTHFHGDHTGGNQNFAQAGSVIVAHHNVRQRMSVEQFNDRFKRSIPASPPDALPVITFHDDVRFHWNGDTLQMKHLPNAHTDGDTIVHFLNAKVIHTGDIVLNGRFPYIDTSAGGSLHGLVAAVTEILDRCDDETLVIPGHGDLMTHAQVEEYLRMLETSIARVGQLKDAGKTLEQVVAEKPMADYDEGWGRGFIGTEAWVEAVFNGL